MTLAKAKKPTKAQTAARLKRESALLTKLQNDHQFMLEELPNRSERFTARFNRRTGTITAYRHLILIFPNDSALAAQIAKMDKKGKKP